MATPSLERLAAWDRALCARINSASHFAAVRLVFAVASRLGNGIFWYALMAALLIVKRSAAVPVVLHMIGVGAVGTLIYKTIKAHTSRPRPLAAEIGVVVCVAPLDQ